MDSSDSQYRRGLSISKNSKKLILPLIFSDYFSTFKFDYSQKKPYFCKNPLLKGAF